MLLDLWLVMCWFGVWFESCGGVVCGVVSVWAELRFCLVDWRSMDVWLLFGVLVL